MSINKFLGKYPTTTMIVALSIFILSLIGIVSTLLISQSNAFQKQTYECISKGGTLVEGIRMNFCVKEFIELEPNKD